MIRRFGNQEKSMDQKKRHAVDDPEAKLRELLKQESNSRCADCGAAKPRYASITLGIFICNRCYGIHRSIGTHITRTKCVGLDNWSAHDVQRMQSVGNAVAAASWQKNLPNGYSIPTAETSDSVVEKWIRDKYERKVFCPLDSITNQQQYLGYLGVGHSSKEENSQIDDWSPFIGANSAGDWPASNPSSSIGVWDPFNSDALIK